MKFPTTLVKIFGGRQKKNPKTLKEMFNQGMLSREEFLRFKITQTEIKLTKEKQGLAEFLKKRKK